MSIKNLKKNRKEKSINYIVQQGVVTPAMHFAKFRNRIKICNMKTAFYGISDCIFLGVTIGAIFWLMFLQMDTELIGCGVYLLSPLVYIVIYSLVVWKEMVFKLYEMKMVCRYNLQLLSTFRMLYFSMINLVWNSVAILLMQHIGAESVDFIKLLGISFSATFLYGIFMIFLRWTRKTVVSGQMCSVAWLIANVLLICFGGEVFERFLMDLPIYLVMGIVCVSGMLYLIMLLFNVSKRMEGEKEYAFH